MQLTLIRHLWGIDEAWETAFPTIKALGYGGIECPLPPPAERARFRALLDLHGFTYIAQIFTGGGGVAAHVASFREQVVAAKTMKPIFINSHSGNDCWSGDQQRAFFTAALACEAETGATVCHQLHRGRILFNPRDTRVNLESFPGLKICADYSHWVNVCERLPNDQPEAFRLAAERCLHLHARVGYEHGPQVPDPRAPEAERYVLAHERWWDQIWDSQQRRGFAISTLTPEFGPPGYLHTQPYTQMPVANLWDICNWQAKRQAERFAARATAAKAH